MKKSPAFTLVEIALVIGILALITIPFFSHYLSTLRTKALTTAASQVEDIATLASTFSRERKDGAVWGVKKLNDTAYAIVSDKSGTETVFQEVTLPKGITITIDYWQDPYIWYTEGTTDLLKPAKIILDHQSGDQTIVNINIYGTINIQ